MTEDEAKKKWCPHGRVHNCSGAYNRTKSEHAGGPSSCIASQCMMWRWRACHEEGYCGLAGSG